MKQLKISYYAMIVVYILTGCVAQETVVKETKPVIDPAELTMDTQLSAETKSSTLAPMSRSFRMPQNSLASKSPRWFDNKRYSLDVKDLALRNALALFGRLHDMNIIVDQGVEGNVTASFRDLAFRDAMSALLSAYDFSWEEVQGVIRVSQLKTKNYSIDYIRLVRGGESSSSTSISSQSGGSSVSSNASSSSQVTQTDSIKFWAELEKQLSVIISEKGKVVINSLSGDVQVTDTPSTLRNIDSFLSSLQKSVHRQVEIHAKIIEVSLRDDHSLGVDWSRISENGHTNLSTDTAISSILGGVGIRSSTITGQYVSRQTTALLTALQEQGNVRILSQPKIRSLNNQTAMIKVGTDMTFFTKTSTRLVSDGVSEIVESEEAATVTEGIVMSVTPQVSGNGWVMLDIAPVITHITDTVTSSNGSTAPVLDIKQATALIRVKNGDVVVLGGLMQHQKSETERNVPILSKIPFLGGLFKSRYKTSSTKEIVILLQPIIVG